MERQTEAQTVMTGNERLMDPHAALDDSWHVVVTSHVFVIGPLLPTSRHRLCCLLDPVVTFCFCRLML